MLFITDRIKEVQIKQGEVVKLSLLHKVCNFHNEGTQPALIQHSTNGYDWKALITVEPDSTTPISMDADTLYVRLVSKTVVNLKAIKPIPRNQAPQTPAIHSPSVLVKEDLHRYVTIEFLNDFIAQLPKTDTLTRDEILALIPESTQLPDLSGYALKSDLQTDDIIATIDELTQTILELQANNQDPKLMNAINMLDMSVRYMEETKADTTALQNALSAFERLMESHQKTQEKVTGLSSTIAQQVSTEALERMVERLRVLIDTRATKDDLDALTDTVEHKASIDWVAQNTNYILGLIQDKANKVYVDELYEHIRNKVVAWDDLSNKPAQFNPISHTHPWSQITGVPSFAPSSHTHRINNISGLTDALDNKLGVNGNAVSASKLAKAVSINGIEFDGTRDITIPFSSNDQVLLTDNGYAKLSNGLIIQWVRHPITLGNSDFLAQYLIFPIEFPNKALSIHTSLHTPPSHATYYVAHSFGNISRRGYSVKFKKVISSERYDGEHTLYTLAIGY